MFLDMTARSLLYRYRRFKRTCCLHFHRQRVGVKYVNSMWNMRLLRR